MNYDGPALMHMRRPAQRATIEVPREKDSNPRSACYNDPRFISTDRADREAAIEICDGCYFRACQDVMADLLPSERANLKGVWDGTYYSEAQSRRGVAGGVA
ncbi:hypothetical protein LRP67_16375 [Nocardioides sp. cx-169]|uniref:hypothetical protein n=1 Tax=Nocardioides sp. cx-169 TaxID=2899080 RepID=UPI001E41964E|nr:hypothetical protein [Nocardioides sp. cx-169]MCD4535670.1 hypothetical protein [Nocardioides sp. cx-169]